MKVQDKAVGEMVDVARRDCLTRGCYQPRPDPGVYNQGRGYRPSSSGKWICGRRTLHGCPAIPKPGETAKRPVCVDCGGDYVVSVEDTYGVVLRCVKCGGRYWNANDRWSDEELVLVPVKEGA